MEKLDFEQMEMVEGGAKEIPWWVCSIAFVGTFFWPIGTAIAGPTSLGCLINGESIYEHFAE